MVAASCFGIVSVLLLGFVGGSEVNWRMGAAIVVFCGTPIPLP